MTLKLPDYNPKLINRYVPSQAGGAYVDAPMHSGMMTAVIGAPDALDADGLLVAQSIATAGSATSFAATYNVINGLGGAFGRCVSIVLSGVGTPTVTIDGRDIHGQPVREALTGNGTTPVNGVKAFKWIDKVTWTVVAATTMNVGWIDTFGIPFKAIKLFTVYEDNAASTGTLTAAVLTDPQTATTGDPRGRIVVQNAANGTRVYSVEYMIDRAAPYGVRHFGG